MNDELDFESLVLIMGGHTAFQLCWSGVQLGIFDQLAASPGMSREVLAKASGLEPRPFRILLTGLLAMKMILRDGDGLRNAEMVNQLLVRSTPHNWVEVLGWQNYIVYPGEVDFLESLKQNRNVGLRQFPGDEDNLYARLTHDKFLEKVFQDSMASLSLSANAIMVENVDFSGIRHLVDGGGGNATNLMAVARANPHLSCTVFDSASVCEIAKANIERNGLSDRIGTHPGDLFSTPFPSGIDGVLLAHMLTIWSPEKNIQLLKRVYDALPDGGQVIIFNMMGHDDETGPMTTALGSPYFLSIATGEGMLYTWAEFESFLAAAGFRQTKRVVLPKDHGVLIGVKG